MCVALAGVFAADTQDDEVTARQATADAAQQLLHTPGMRLDGMRQHAAEASQPTPNTVPREQRSGDIASMRDLLQPTFKFSTAGMLTLCSMLLLGSEVPVLLPRADTAPAATQSPGMYIYCSTL